MRNDWKLLEAFRSLSLFSNVMNLFVTPVFLVVYFSIGVEAASKNDKLNKFRKSSGNLLTGPAADKPQEEETEEENTIKWINIIFLPFQLWWQLIIMVIVCIKCFMSPYTAVFRIIKCSTEETSGAVGVLKVIYEYICDPLYLCDTFLHIVHRQVQEEAMKREFTPKSAPQLLCDILSVLPFFSILSDDLCAPLELWPHLTNFNGMFLLYRLIDFFCLGTTHNYFMMALGYTIIYALVMNAATCALLLWTYTGLCDNCLNPGGVYDWRYAIYLQFHRTEFTDFELYYFALVFVQSYFLNIVVDGGGELPITYTETIIADFLMITGKLSILLIVWPKLFSEALMRLKRINDFHPRVKRIITETKNRQSSPTSYKSVEDFYKTIWTKRFGITDMPRSIYDLPKYMRINIQQDLVWAVFHHSPCLKRSSDALKRWLGQHIDVTFKQAGERFFSGEHCYSNIYYIKSGIVQLISADDSTSPMLSVTDGTLFGGISYFIPPLNRQVIVRCLTYCELFTIRRGHILRALHLFPEDRRNIMKLVQDKLKHAHDLFKCKAIERGFDRAEDEGIAWLKRRWWSITNAVKHWKYSSTSAKKKCEIPHEECNYHCAKYIGQLVLCKENSCRQNSIFIKSDFPWILEPNCSFSKIWHWIVKTAVAATLILRPPYIVESQYAEDSIFSYSLALVDIVYLLDTVILLFTACESLRDTELSLSLVMTERFKSKYYILDLCASPLIDLMLMFIVSGNSKSLLRFNRLLKIYMLFFETDRRTWHKNIDPLTCAFYWIVMVKFCIYYITPFFLYIVTKLFPNTFNRQFLFGDICLNGTCPWTPSSISPSFGVFAVVIGWLAESFLTIHDPESMADIILNCIQMLAKVLFINIFLEVKFVSALFLKYRERVNYHFFVSNLTNHYKRIKAHPDLLKRLERYLDCHWKHFHGMDIMHTKLLKDEPYEIYWRLHGERAEKLIGQSRAFAGVDQGLIRELAEAATFLVLPKNTTLIMFGLQVENLTWISRGHIKCEYNDDKNETRTVYISDNDILATTAIFFDRVPLRTYTAGSDVEVLYIQFTKYNKIMARYPIEQAYIKKVVDEIRPQFDELFVSYVKKHKGYQKKLRERVFHARQSPSSSDSNKIRNEVQMPRFLKAYTEDPEAPIILTWLFIRMIAVVIQLMALTINAVSEPSLRELLLPVLITCDVAATIGDMIFKMFMPFYDDRGIVISKYYRCLMKYLSRNFLIDALCIMSCNVRWVQMIFSLNDPINARIVEVGIKYLLLYHVIGFFNYWSNRPSAFSILIVMLKWQIVLILLASFGVMLLMKACLNFNLNQDLKVANVTISATCWIPTHIKPLWSEYYATTWSAVQGCLMDFLIGHLNFEAVPVQMTIIYLVLVAIFWYISSQCLSLLLLSYQGETMFQHGISQLKNFLQGERVGKNVIENSLNYFIYWWKRTAGVNMKILMNERVGVIFRQDLNYFFYNYTLDAVDELLGGDEELPRQLASYTTEMFFLPKQDITREMDLNPEIYIVHRGQINITKGDEFIATLSKGSLFGQLDGSTLRPLNVTATAKSHVDVLAVPVSEFQKVINDQVRQNIARITTTIYDFIAVKHTVQENPFKTLGYILRGNKVIKLPKMNEPVVAEENAWYQRWLLLVWVVGPIIAAALVPLLLFLPHIDTVLYVMMVIDLLQLIHFISDLFEMEYLVTAHNSQYEYVGWRKIAKVTFYVDIFALFLPAIGFFLTRYSRYYHLPRVLRLYTVLVYHRMFCENCQSQFLSTILRIIAVLLLMHTMTCLWMGYACVHKRDVPFPVRIFKIPAYIQITIDRSEWEHPDRRGSKDYREGCPRATPAYVDTVNGEEETRFSWLVPRNWQADYVVAFTFITTLFTRMDISYAMFENESYAYFKIVATHILYIVFLWISSVVISVTYAKLRDMYSFDYEVDTLLKYLKQNNVSVFLQKSVLAYTKLLWQRQKGNWLPEMTKQAPLCLREDILSSLYMHHLLTPALFAHLPPYFLRQLVVKLKRIVIFPGKSIVKTGDINPITYFIHEGEVEKWFTDANGDSRMVSLLTINGYFGLVPGLFPKVPYQFTFVTRTVADLVFLDHYDWQDLLSGYPDIKQEIYATATAMRKSQDKSQSKKRTSTTT